MEIRLLAARDIGLVLPMNRDFREGLIDPENIRRFLENPSDLLFAAIEDGRVVGFAYGYRMARMDAQGDMVYLHEVGVLPEYRRQGVGRAIMLYIREYCRENGLSKFFLITQHSNVPACRLYEGAGGKWSDLADRVYWFKANDE